MDGLALIGCVGRDIIRIALDNAREDYGVARLVLHGLEKVEIAAIVLAIQEDKGLSQRLDVCLPLYGFSDFVGISPENLTSQNTSDLRHAECAQEARLLILLDESQAQSLSQVVPIDAETLKSQEHLRVWLGHSGAAAGLDNEQSGQWGAAVRALLELDRVSLSKLAQYLIGAAEGIAAGLTLPIAFGRALPLLRLPRYDGLFDDIPPARRGHYSQWRQRLLSHWRRDCFVYKRDQNQVPFSAATLRKKLGSMAASLEGDVYAVLAGYVDAAAASGPAAFAPFELDWPAVRAFFDEVQRSDTKSIGLETRTYYRSAQEGLLTADDWDHVDKLADERGRTPIKGPRDIEFYNDHATEIRQDARLAALWDRFIFGPEIPCSDFIDGLLQCVRRLYKPNALGRQILIVEGRENSQRSFYLLNEDICAMFAAQYRGLDTALDGLVIFKYVLAFRHESFAEEIQSRRKGGQSTARKARQLRFTVRMEENGVSSGSIRLVWEGSLEAVGVGLPGDLERLRDNRTKTPLVRCSAGYRRQRALASHAGISLRDMSGLDPASQRSRGSFVPASSKCESLATAWRRALTEARKAGVIDKDAGKLMSDAFDAFEAVYSSALSDWANIGFRAISLDLQAKAYGAVIDAVCSHVAKHPIVIESLLRPLFEIGVAPISGTSSDRSSLILCPWHPLRLEALHAQLMKFRGALETLLTPSSPEFADGGALYFNELKRNLGDAARPDLTLTWPTAQRILVCEVDALHGYSLMERPVTKDCADTPRNENVLPTARQIADLAQVYLKLQPHERDNLSVVLYNCDVAALPQAVVDAIRKDADKNGEEAMCQVILRHTDGEQLRSLYQQLVQHELLQDGLHSSEAARDFMSRLRISILVNEQGQSHSGDGPPFDIVFCHDVISRQADLGWSDIPRIVKPAVDIHPAQWSRRKAIGRFDRDAILHLTCPAQTAVGWSFLDAIAVLVDADLASSARARGHCRVPDRRTVLQADDTRQVLDETHRLGAWVVNFDDLLDRRQLINGGISVIRYKHAAVGNRSLIISSKASDTLLRATLCSRLREVDRSLDAERAGKLAGKLIAEANSVSGDIVLRAARRGTSAGELIGVVLSKYLIDQELGDRVKAWVFLDDYASWLGQAEGRMADLLCLAPVVDDKGNYFLDVIVTEAKFIKGTKIKDKADISQAQLKSTLRRFEKALSSTSEPADAKLWRARLAEMLYDSQRDGSSLDPNWRTAVRDGNCIIRVAGYSHVFIHGGGATEASQTDEVVGVEGTSSGTQERFSQSTVRQIVRAFAEQSNPTAVREQLGAALLAKRPTNRCGPLTDHQNEAPPEPDDRVICTIDAGSSDASAAIGHEQADLGDNEPENASPLGFWQLINRWAQERPSVDGDVEWLDETARRCRAALLRYGMSAHLEHQVLTPNAALLRFRGSDDLTVAKVENKLKELESTHGLELIGVRAEPGFVVVSIKRPHRVTLGVPEVWARWTVEHGKANARLLIGIKEGDGSPLFLEPEPAPHTLVAGSTGSGKSILIQNIILGIAATNTPEQAKIILIDPKSGVDYFAFEALPHLDGPIIDVEDQALARLDALVAEMQRRYSLFKQARVSNIGEYNQASQSPLPRIWLVHDEFADWMQLDSYRGGVETAVNRLGVKARAAGIYLIFAAQRPDASVFPMQLRSNLGNRLILRVDSAGTSDLSLGIKNGGAERLLGKGHLAAIIGGGISPTYAQVPFIDNRRLEILVAALTLRSNGLGDEN